MSAVATGYFNINLYFCIHNSLFSWLSCRRSSMPTSQVVITTQLQYENTNTSKRLMTTTLQHYKYCSKTWGNICNYTILLSSDMIR